MVTLIIQQALLDRLAALPELKVVEVFEGQGTGQKAGSVKTTPAAYLELKSQIHRQLGLNAQMLKLSLEITLLTKVENDATEKVKGTGEAHYLAADAIYKALEGTRLRTSEIKKLEIVAGTEQDISLCGSMNRISLLENLKEPLMKTVQTFSFTAKDTAALRKFRVATPEKKVTSELIEL